MVTQDINGKLIILSDNVPYAVEEGMFGDFVLRYLGNVRIISREEVRRLLQGGLGK